MREQINKYLNAHDAIVDENEEFEAQKWEDVTAQRARRQTILAAQRAERPMLKAIAEQIESQAEAIAKLTEDANPALSKKYDDVAKCVDIIAKRVDTLMRRMGAAENWLGRISKEVSTPVVLERAIYSALGDGTITMLKRHSDNFHLRGLTNESPLLIDALLKLAGVEISSDSEVPEETRKEKQKFFRQVADGKLCSQCGQRVKAEGDESDIKKILLDPGEVEFLRDIINYPGSTDGAKKHAATILDAAEAKPAEPARPREASE